MTVHFSDVCGVLIVYYALMSSVAFIYYRRDKQAARKHLYRVPERKLLLLSFFGGWPGALLAQRYLRHKSSKPAFLRWFWLMLVINLCLLIGLIWLYFDVTGRGALASLFYFLKTQCRPAPGCLG